MKIALYYPWIHLTSGAERSILELARRSRHDWTIFTNHFDRKCTYPEFENVKIVELPKVPVDRSFTKVMKVGLRLVRQKIELNDFDAFLVVCEGMGDMIVFRNHEVPVFCLCLTPMRPVYDPLYKDTYLSGRGWSAKFKLMIFGMFFAMLDRLAWKYYEKVICISRECYNRVLAGKLAGEEKMTLAFPGIDYKSASPTGRFEKYFLLPGRIMWTKNIELGIRAFRKFQRECPEAAGFRLKIAGIVDKKSEPYYEKLKDMAGDNGIEFIMHPTDQELFELYDGAYSVLFTPFNEDWGMVPLEAMVYAKPVVAVNRGGPRETVVHGVTGYLAEPTVDSFAHYMAELAASPDQARIIGEKGRLHVEKYDWKYFVDAIDEMIML